VLIQLLTNSNSYIPPGPPTYLLVPSHCSCTSHIPPVPVTFSPDSCFFHISPDHRLILSYSICSFHSFPDPHMILSYSICSFHIFPDPHTFLFIPLVPITFHMFISHSTCSCHIHPVPITFFLFLSHPLIPLTFLPSLQKKPTKIFCCVKVH